VISGSSEGTRCPYGITGGTRGWSGKLLVAGGSLGQQYGQGRASRTPYFNWHVLSIYYVPALQKIVLGIEEDRYHSLKQLPPYQIMKIPGRTKKVAAFDEYPKDEINYEKLYLNFVHIAEKIMELGL